LFWKSEQPMNRAKGLASIVALGVILIVVLYGTLRPMQSTQWTPEAETATVRIIGDPRVHPYDSIAQDEGGYIDVGIVNPTPYSLNVTAACEVYGVNGPLGTVRRKMGFHPELAYDRHDWNRSVAIHLFPLKLADVVSAKC